MDPLDELLFGLHVIALRIADRVPTPAEPADSAWEAAADEYCLRLARTNEVEKPSPEVASALIPRLRLARLFAPLVQAAFAQQAALGDAASDEGAILELLLITQWHKDWKKEWLAGEFPD